MAEAYCDAILFVPVFVGLDEIFGNAVEDGIREAEDPDRDGVCVLVCAFECFVTVACVCYGALDADLGSIVYLVVLGCPDRGFDRFVHQVPVDL